MVKYPLFCWSIDDHHIHSLALGLDWQMVDTRLANLKKGFSDWVRYQNKQGYPLDEPELEQVKMQFFTVRIRLAYREEKGQYAVPTPLRLNVAAAYGHDPEAGHWKCYLPILDSEFFYYEENQLESLVDHFSRELLEGANPEFVHRYVMRSTPWLEEVRVKLSSNAPQTYTIPYKEEAETNLGRISEKQPKPRAQRKRLHLVPEAAWERTETIEMLCKQLLEAPSSLLLIGETGTGKTAIWLEVVKRVWQKTRSREQAFSFWRTSAQRLIAEARYLGEWQAICDQLVEDLNSVNGILWLADPINLLNLGGASVADSVAAYLLPLIQAGELTVIGEMSPREVEAARHQLPGFIESFKCIELEKLKPEQVHSIAEHFNRYCKTNLKIECSQGALALSYSLLERHLQYEEFPGKLIHFLSNCIGKAKKNKQSQLDESSILKEFIEKTGLPEIILRDDLVLEPTQLQDFFAQRILGQKEALRQLCSVINVYKAGLNDPAKPIATLLFAGPTGVGKTAAAKALASYFFRLGKNRQPLFRIDMSEFQHPHQLGRLIGNDARHPGKLIQHVRNRPFSVILLDEIEKADPRFFDILLSVLDEGRLSDAFGRSTDFRQSILIMTSNLGTSHKASIGFSPGAKDSVEAAVRAFFRPEFFNRIGQLVCFAPLDKTTIKDIALQELQALETREGLSRRKLTLHFSDALVQYIATIGFDAELGARPLQRAIELLVVGSLSRYLLANRALCDCTLQVDYGEKRGVYYSFSS